MKFLPIFIALCVITSCASQDTRLVKSVSKPAVAQKHCGYLEGVAVLLSQDPPRFQPFGPGCRCVIVYKARDYIEIRPRDDFSACVKEQDGKSK